MDVDVLWFLFRGTFQRLDGVGELLHGAVGLAAQILHMTVVASPGCEVGQHVQSARWQLDRDSRQPAASGRRRP